MKALANYDKCSLLLFGLLSFAVPATQGTDTNQGIGVVVPAGSVYARQSGQEVPAGFTVERYARLWNCNPFTLSNDPSETRPSAFENLYLIGWLNDRGKLAVSVQNSETNEVQRITAESNQNNLRLVRMHLSSNLQLVDAVIASSQEQGTVKFRIDLQVAPGITNPARPESHLNASGGQATATSTPVPRIFPGVRRVRSEGGRPAKVRLPKFPAATNPSITGQG